MAGYHQLLVGRDDMDREATVAHRYQGCPRRIRCGIERAAQPGQLFHNPRPHARRVFADSSGEHEAIDAPERCRQKARLQSDPIGEVIESEPGARFGTRFEFAHVVADTRQALQSTFLVKKILDFGRAHSLFLDEVKHHSGVDLTGPRSHRQPVQRRVAHRALDASPAYERTHRSAAAEMSHDDPAGRDPRRHERQAARDKFIGQAVEAVAAYALRVEPLRDRVMVSDRAVAAVERGVEAGDLGKAGHARKYRTHRREIVWLMERRQRNIAFEMRQNLQYLGPLPPELMEYGAVGVGLLTVSK